MTSSKRASANQLSGKQDQHEQRSTERSPMKFVLPLLVCMLLAAGGAWIFGTAMQSTYPDGFLLSPPGDGEPGNPMDAFYVGMGIGSFFFLLIYAVMTLSTFLLGRLHSNPLKHLTAPLFSSSLLCLFASVGFLVLAN
jgi:hypothetical protein